VTERRKNRELEASESARREAVHYITVVPQRGRRCTLRGRDLDERKSHYTNYSDSRHGDTIREHRGFEILLESLAISDLLHNYCVLVKLDIGNSFPEFKHAEVLVFLQSSEILV